MKFYFIRAVLVIGLLISQLRSGLFGDIFILLILQRPKTIKKFGHGLVLNSRFCAQ